jgi:hypothetical protein
MSAFAPPPPPEVAKKKGSGCVLLLVIAGGFALLVLLLALLALGYFASTPEGQKVVTVARETFGAMQEFQNAPGAKEVRALGCDQAMIIPMDRVMEIAAPFVDGGTAELPPGSPRLTITCVAPWTASPPKCQAIADTYVRAVGGRAQGVFLVTTQRPGSQKPACTSMHSESGKLLRDATDGPGHGEAPAEEVSPEDEGGDEGP